jgi:hypothetical protein
MFSNRTPVFKRPFILTVALIISVQLTLAAVSGRGVAMTDDSNQNSDDSSNQPAMSVSEEVPPWPLPPLNAEEREARLQFFLQTQNFKFDPSLDDSSPDECLAILRSLSDPKRREVLTPVQIGSRANDKIEEVIQQCPRLNIDRVWFSAERGPLTEGVDAQFDELPLSDKDRKADFFYRYDEAVELYDLSSFFSGVNLWSTFAEPGVVICNDGGRDLCRKLSGYRRYSGVIASAVFVPETCSRIAGPKSTAQSRLRSSTPGVVYTEYPNLYAYLSIDDKPYRVSLNSDHPWSEFSQLTNPNESTSLIIELLTPERSFQCRFISTLK